MDRLLDRSSTRAPRLVKRPLFATSIVVTLALGIGANAAVFGVIDALLVHPFDMRDVDRIVMPIRTSPKWTGHRETVSPADFLDWRRDFRGGALEHLAAVDWWDANLVGRDEPERVLGFFVSPAFFQAFDASPAIGRMFLPEEEAVRQREARILSDGLWKRRFGADPGDRRQGDPRRRRTMARRRRDAADASAFPMRAEVWAPLDVRRGDGAKPDAAVPDRLRPARRPAARSRTRAAQLTAIAAAARARSSRNERAAWLAGAHAQPRHGRRRRAVGAGAVAGGRDLRAADCVREHREPAARARRRARARDRDSPGARARAAGASCASRFSRARCSSLAVGSACAPGRGLGDALRVMHGFMPARIVRYIAGWDRMGLDAWTIGAALLCAAVAAVASGTLPALHMSFGVVSDALKTDGRTGAGPGRQRLRRALVVAEIALALPLLVAAVLSASTITRFLTELAGLRSGRRADDAHVAAGVALPGRRQPRAIRVARARRADRDSRRARGRPSRTSCRRSIRTGSGRSRSRAEPQDSRSKAPEVDYRAVSPQYFDVLRMPVARRTAFTPADREDAEPVAIVSESMARKFWPDGERSRQPVAHRRRTVAARRRHLRRRRARLVRRPLADAVPAAGAGARPTR